MTDIHGYMFKTLLSPRSERRAAAPDLADSQASPTYSRRWA